MIWTYFGCLCSFLGNSTREDCVETPVLVLPLPWQEWTGRTGRSGNDRHGLGWLGSWAGWLAVCRGFFSALLLGCTLQVALQIKKERPQGTREK